MLDKLARTDLGDTNLMATRIAPFCTSTHSSVQLDLPITEPPCCVPSYIPSGSLPGKPCPALFQSFDSFSVHIDAVVCSLQWVDHETADCGISIHTLTRFTSSQSCLLEIAVASYLSEFVVAFPDLKHEPPLPGAFKLLTK